MTTQHVVQTLILKNTEFWKCSYTDLLKYSNDPQAVQKEQLCGPATHYVIHYWQFKFLSLVSAIENYFDEIGEDKGNV